MPTNDELQIELAALRDELRQLRSQLTTPAAAVVRVAEPRLMSRRNLLRAAPVVAAGGALAALAASPAAAALGDPVLQGKVNDAGTTTTTLKGGTPWDIEGIDVSQPAALAVQGGFAGDWLTLDGIVVGSNQGAALVASPNSVQGLAGLFKGPPVEQLHGSAGGPSVLVTAMGPGAGVTVNVTDGSFSNPSDPQGGETPLPSTALQATSQTGPALSAGSSETVVALTSRDAATTKDALTIGYAGRSRALWAESTSKTNINGTITGVNAGNGIGVWGEQRGAGAGFGLVGLGGKAGRGARLSGGAAALRMLPSSAATHPHTGKTGDFFVDVHARLWYCKKASVGNVAATWKQLA